MSESKVKALKKARKLLLEVYEEDSDEIRGIDRKLKLLMGERKEIKVHVTEEMLRGLDSEHAFTMALSEDDALIESLSDKLTTYTRIFNKQAAPAWTGEFKTAIYDGMYKIDTVLPSGQYNVTATVFLKGDKRRDQTWPLDQTKYTLKVKTKIGDLLWEIMDHEQYTRGAQYFALSGTPHVHLEDIIIRPIGKQNLRRIQLRGAQIQYPHKVLGDVSAININPGMCVLDYVMAEILNKNLQITREQLQSELAKACIGPHDEAEEEHIFSVGTMMRWAQTRDTISIYALDAYGKVFAHSVAAQCKLLLCFIVNNNHVYPVMNADDKRSIAKSKRLIKEFAMHPEWRNPVEWEPDGSPLPAGHTILVNAMDIGELALKVTEETKQFVYNCVIPEGGSSRVTMFEHPVTNQIIVAAPEWKERKATLEALITKDRYLGYEWKNQTWGLIGRTIFERHFGSLAPSHYGPELLQIYEKSTLKPLIYRTGKQSDDGVSVDTRRCYTSILMNNTDPFPSPIRWNCLIILGKPASIMSRSLL